MRPWWSDKVWPGEAMKRKATRSFTSSKGVSARSAATFFWSTRVITSSVLSAHSHSTG